MESEHLSDREKAAVLWAEHVTRNTARERDDVYDIVRAQFTDPEIVELTLMSGFFNLFNRLMDSLRIPVEVPHEVAKIQRSLHLDPDRVRGYLQTLLDNWPDAHPTPNPD